VALTTIESSGNYALEAIRMGTVFNYPNLVAAIDGAEGLKDKGFSFLDRDQKSTFVSFDGLRSEAMRRAAHFRSH
jgi:hypothetical protein